MPTYISSKGEVKDTSDMPIEYIQRALAIAKKENNIIYSNFYRFFKYLRFFLNCRFKSC
jgi:hypothetical protein